MATEADKLKVGMFLIVGFLLFAGSLVWVGASHVLEKTDVYVTYFDESVLGLDIGSSVKYRGVQVGRVAAIQVAPDGRLVEVDMSIEQQFRAAPGLRATLANYGITGISTIELAFPRDGVTAPLALSFRPPERYIPSQPSLMNGLMGALTDVAAGLRGADLRALVADYRAVADAVRQRLAGPEVDRVLARVGGAAEGLEVLTRRLAQLAEDPRLPQLLDRLNAAAQSAQALVADPRIAQTLDEARAAAAALRRAAEDVRAEVATLRAGERLDAVQRGVERTLSGVDSSVSSAAGGARETTEAATKAAARWERVAADLDRSLEAVLGRLDRAAGRLESLAASLDAAPSRILEKPRQEGFR